MFFSQSVTRRLYTKKGEISNGRLSVPAQTLRNWNAVIL